MRRTRDTAGREDTAAARAPAAAPEAAGPARAAVEQAKGVLAERFGCDVETAYDRLLELAAGAGVEPETAAALLLGAAPETPGRARPGSAAERGGVPRPRPPDRDDGGPPGPAAQLAQMERLGGLGWGRWDLATGEARWSAGLYELLGRDRAAGPAPLDRLAEQVVAADLPHARHFMRALLGRREPADAELRVRAGGAVRHLRAMAEPVLDARGEPVAVQIVFQDASRGRGDELLAATRLQLMRQRRRIAEERRTAVELQRALLPLPRGPRDLPGLRAAVRYLPACGGTRVGGDWYEATALSGGEVFLAIGDVAGHGPAAAAGMARVRNALSGLACTGAAPDRMLAALNRMLLSPEPLQARGRGPAPTAGAVAARYEPGPRVLTWARAGHPPPVLVRDGAAALLEAPEGVLLGAVDAPDLESVITRLHRGDLLLFYTDGLVERRDRDLADGFRMLLAAAAERPGARTDAVVDHVLRSLGGANPDDDTCVLAVQVA
ncbi:SpoIIE family protein phosphatase [Actinomadura verrucosospora]|uniref:Magnesium or manganese-dependent protein phosphatase n=1 Tax=Actinomadura verrucosospora TaxID=46165 RepID=A0A7D3VTA2_ACTVE|nr:SpoIIE family protein phosphatase [Actinomadura verrucosospora]QKG19356.1 Magnesium or manganese-dependent protein phosphatase [Actinomadura verrucosospora]